MSNYEPKVGDKVRTSSGDGTVEAVDKHRLSVRLNKYDNIVCNETDVKLLEAAPEEVVESVAKTNPDGSPIRKAKTFVADTIEEK